MRALLESFQVASPVPPQPAPPPPTPPSAPPSPPPAPGQSPAPPSGSVDETPEKAKKYVKYSMIWVALSVLIYLALMGINWKGYIDAAGQHNPNPEDTLAFYTITILLIIFGLIALILVVLIKIKIGRSMESGVWDVATESSFFIGVLAIVFGFGAGIPLILVNKMMKEHPLYLSTLPPPKPVCYRCRNEVRWKTEMNKWYCEHCKIYL